MKTFRLLALPAALLLALSLPGCGQDARPKSAPLPADATSSAAAADAAEQARQAAAKWNVRVDVLIVSLPETRALELLPDLRSDDPQKTSAAVTTIQQMIGAKEATLIGWPEVICLDGVRSVTETIDEKRYPSNFTVPAPADTEPAPADKPDSQPTSADFPTPSAFETRNIGVTLEAEPRVLDDGRRLLLTVVPQHVRLLGFIPYGGESGTDSQPSLIDQPEFATTKATTTLSLRNDQRVLLAMHKLDPDKDTVELFILHALATKVD